MSDMISFNGTIEIDTDALAKVFDRDKNWNQYKINFLHFISLPEGDYGNNNVRDLFLNRLNLNSHETFVSLKNVSVSSHLFIKRTGEIIQFVPFDKVAWHAGVSNYRGRNDCNEFSIGIELEGTIKDYFEDMQYKKLNEIICCLRKEYRQMEVVGHKDVAPSRKLDPGEKFDWERLNIVK